MAFGIFFIFFNDNLYNISKPRSVRDGTKMSISIWKNEEGGNKGGVMHAENVAAGLCTSFFFYNIRSWVVNVRPLMVVDKGKCNHHRLM